MAVHRLKITDCLELLRRHYLGCNVRSETYLKNIAEKPAINDAVDNGWIQPVKSDGRLNYYLTSKGNEVVNGHR